MIPPHLVCTSFIANIVVHCQYLFTYFSQGDVFTVLKCLAHSRCLTNVCWKNILSLLAWPFTNVRLLPPCVNIYKIYFYIWSSFLPVRKQKNLMQLTSQSERGKIFPRSPPLRHFSVSLFFAFLFFWWKWLITSPLLLYLSRFFRSPTKCTSQPSENPGIDLPQK